MPWRNGAGADPVNVANAVRGFRPNPIVGLGTLGGLWSKAYDINDDGLVVGVAHADDWRSRPFLWASHIRITLSTHADASCSPCEW